MNRLEIITEVQMQTARDGGQVPGVRRLEAEAGIKEHAWKKYWPRYADLLKDAGLTPNALEEGWSEIELCDFLIELARSLGRFPTSGEIRANKDRNPGFPNHRVFDRRLGRRREIITAVKARAEATGMREVVVMCDVAALKLPQDVVEAEGADAEEADVYLLKSGRHYKIGHSVHAGSRERQLQIQLPERAELVHVIKTDDPRGIEAYWHQRFASKRLNGEWFNLNSEDVRAFRKRKFM